MKTNLRILAILLAGLFAISMMGCGQDDDETLNATTVVDIPDANLRAAIASELEIQDDTSITAEDMLKLTRLDLSDMGIVNLTGLEYATNLTWMDLSDNAIVDISPLKELKNLTALGLVNNAIVDISLLKELKNLTALGLVSNAIVDISPLKELKNLEELHLSGNAIVDVSPLKELKNLDVLELENNAIVDVSPLKELKNLKSVSLGGNPLSQESVEIHIPAIEANGTYVEYYTVVEIPDANLRAAIAVELGIQDDTSITTDDILGLTRLNLSDMDIANLTGLEYATDLWLLDLSGNAIVDISPLKELTNLEALELSENPLSQESVEIHIPAIKANGTTVIYD